MVLSPALKFMVICWNFTVFAHHQSKSYWWISFLSTPPIQNHSNGKELEISRWGAIWNRFLSIVPSTALRSKSRTFLEQRQETTCKCRWYVGKKLRVVNSLGNDAVCQCIPSGKFVLLHCEEERILQVGQLCLEWNWCRKKLGEEAEGDDTTLMTESKELKSLLMKVKKLT